MTQNISRRSLLKIGSIGALALSASKVLGSPSDECSNTPRQPEGPFYPVKNQFDKDYDLTRVQGKTARALGDIIYLSGTVRDQHCAAVPNVVVEIWQACTSGRYNHPGDESDSPLDPNFQYWGIVSTDTSGSYRFKTIIPGHYYASANWIRPPHIHYKVHKKGYRELVTQMYFAGNQYNDGDLILKGIPEAERGQVVRNLNPRPGEEGRNCFDISFDLTIHRIG